MLNWLAQLFGFRPSAAQLQADYYRSNRPTEPYVIGRTKDLIRLQHMMAADDSRRSLFVYHELREEDEKQWKQEDHQRILTADDTSEFDHLTKLIQQLDEAYTAEEVQDFVHIRPSAADATIAGLCGRYRCETSVARSFLRLGINFGQAWTLLTFSKRAAILGARRGEPELIRDSLIAHAVENLAAEDVRDNFVALGLIFHCARTIDANPTAMFHEVAEMAGPGISQLLRDFVRRSDLDRILTVMGWEEVETPEGVGYRWKI